MGYSSENLLGPNLREDKIQAFRGGGISGNASAALGGTPENGAKNEGMGSGHAGTGDPVSIDGSRFSCERRDCADVPSSEGPIEQELLWLQWRWLACRSGQALFDAPTQQQLSVIRAVNASAKSRAMLRASSHPPVMRMKG
jgi:hypothetical protein